MFNRSMFVAFSLSTLWARTASSADPADPALDAAALACPNGQARIVFHDYDGEHTVLECLTPNGLVISAGLVSLQVYDGSADGIFHNGLDGPQ
jgi:hypothetical protein